MANRASFRNGTASSSCSISGRVGAGLVAKKNPVSYPILINAPDDAVDASLRLGNTQSVLPYTALISRDGHLLKARIGNFSEASFEEWIAPYL